MFNLLYKSYKVEVVKTTSLWTSIKRLKIYEKIFIAITIFGTILSNLFSLVGNRLGSIISFAMILFGFALIMICRGQKSEQKRLIDEIIEPSVKDRTEKIVKLLQKFDIDITDEKQLDSIITYARQEQESYDVWKGLRIIFKGMTTYVLLPIVTIFLAAFFKDNNWEELLIRGGVLLLVCFCIVLLITAFATNIGDLFNPDVRTLNNFIRDLENLKIFSKKVEHIMSTSDK